MKLLILSQQHFKNKHVSQDTIEAFETAIMNVGRGQCELAQSSEWIFKINRRIENRLKKSTGLLVDASLLKIIKQKKPNFIFVMAMGPNTIKYQVKTLKKLNVPLIIYAVDTWESILDEWISVLKQLNVAGILCSNKSTVDKFKNIFPKVAWLPYSMNSKYFHPRQIERYSHLFMQIGRKNKVLHEYVLNYLDEYGLKDSDYIREIKCGQIIYPDFEQLATEICSTRFFILAPRDNDEFEITGAVSDVTARFYEGMACKTLLIGFKPKDTFDTLFPNENAMIVVNSYENFKEKINYYLNHEEEYNRIVEENYIYLVNHHTWEHRAKELFQFISNIS